MSRRAPGVVQVAGHLLAGTPRPGHEPAGVPRFGAHRAQWNLVDALRAHPSIELTLVPSGQAPSPGRSSSPSLSAYDWVHHFGQVFDEEPYRLREQVAPHARLSSNHHTLSYAHLEQAAGVLDGTHDDDVLVASSQAARHVLEDLVAAAAPGWRGQVAVVPLPVSVRPLDAAGRTAVRSALGASDACTVFLSVGRLSRHDKGSLEPLLWTVARLANAGHDIRAVVAGDDTHSYGHELRRLAEHLGVSNRVAVETDVDDARRDELLGAADVFASLYDSHQESFGLAVAEAQAAGLPCLCPAWGSIGELVTNHVDGLTVPTRFLDPGPALRDWRHRLPWRQEHERFAQLVWVDRRELLHAATALTEDSHLRRRLGRQARQAAARYRPDAVAAQYADLWARPAAASVGAGRRARRFAPEVTFGRYAGGAARPPWLWEGDPEEVLAHVGQDLPAAIGLPREVLARVALTLAASSAPLDHEALRQDAGLTYEELLLAVAVLGKHGYLTSAEPMFGRPPGANGEQSDRRPPPK